MPQVQYDPIAGILAKARTSNTVRADAWDAFHDARDVDDLTERLRGLALDDAVKADLWDFKNTGRDPRRPASSEQFTPETPSSLGTSDEWARSLGRAALGSLADSVDPRVTNTVGHGAIGMIKGAGNTATGLTRLARYSVPGVAQIADDAVLAVADEAVQPTNTAQRVGYVGEQAAEFLVPAGAAEKGAAWISAKLAPKFTNTPRLVQQAVNTVPRMATEAAAAGGVATAQGSDPTVAAVAGAASPVVAAGGTAVAPYLRAKAEALTRAAVKPTVSALKRIAGSSASGLDAQANKLVRFMLDNNITTADQARAVVREAEQELQKVMMTTKVPTDAPQRAVRYLQSLERSAAKQGLAADDVATIRNAAAEVVQGVMGKDVIAMVPTSHPTLVGPSGQPITVLMPQASRALRTDVLADEALESARASSRWSTRKQWGEQKGAQMEAQKAVERAQRDAVKAAVPEAAPLLAREGLGRTTTDVLDRMALRTANRDALSLPGVVAGAAEVAGGRLPIIGFAAQWLRNNQMKAGVWTNRLADAIRRQDVQDVSAILNRLGVGVTAQAGGQP